MRREDRVRSWGSVLLILVLVLASSHQPPTPTTGSTRVMVQLSDGTWEGQTIDAGTDELQEMIAEESVLAVEPMRIYYESDPPNPPSDPAYPDQWHLHRNQAARGWRYGNGTGVVVAVIDSGIAPISDLDCHEYVAPFDVRSGQATVPTDTTGHGTFVTSVIAECTNNEVAGAGTAPGVSIMPVGIMDATGSATTESLYTALEWARENGANVVNLSLGFACSAPHAQCNDPAVDTAISNLVASGVAVVAASGNTSGSFLSYPANHPDVVAVGASGYDGAIASYSTSGAGTSIVAPTGDQNDPSGKRGVLHQGWSGLAFGSGTSFSAPQVSAAIAILLSAGAIDVSVATSAILQSAEDISPSGYDQYTGYGDLRIRNAIAWGGLGITPPIKDAAFHGVGDFNGDASADVVTYDGAFGRWWVQRSNDDGFTPGAWASGFSPATGWTSHVGDFNGDGKDDIANYYAGNGTWWISKSNGTKFSTSLWASGFSPSTGWTSHVGDFNGDGKDDIANYYAGIDTWFLSISKTTKFSTTAIGRTGAGPSSETHLIGDFGGDGKDDIASFSHSSWWVLEAP